MPERRKYIRLDTSVNIEYKIAGRTLPEKTTKSRNISAGGVRIFLKEKLHVGNRLEMQFTLTPGSNPINVIGIVAWQNPPDQNGEYDTGVQYANIENNDIHKITEYVLKCLGQKLSQTQQTIDINKKVNSLLFKEIRLPGDKSKNIKPPDFLVEEINLPGDKVRYARISSFLGLRYKLSSETFTPAMTQALSQYVGSKGLWFLSDKQLDIGTSIDILLDIPDGQPPIKASGQVKICKKEIRYNDTQETICYEINMRFTTIDHGDRKRIIRYVYDCKTDYMMIGKVPPPGWLKLDSA